MSFRRLLTYLVSALVVAFGFAPFASAHVLQTDGSIGAVMHIEPDDDPIAKQPADFYFEFQDSSNKFKTADCDCTAVISEGDKQLATIALFKTTETSGFVTPQFSFTFPQKDVYDVKITGTPKTNGEFQSFVLDYIVRVDRQADSDKQSSLSSDHTFHYILFGSAFLFILILYVRESRKGKKSNKSKGITLPLLAALALGSFLVHGSMLDTALCLHGHPVMQDHHCCVAPAVTISSPTTPTASLVYYRVLNLPEYFYHQANFNFFSNRSPPALI